MRMVTLILLSDASSLALPIQMWNPSNTRSAFGCHWLTHEPIHLAPSPVNPLILAVSVVRPYHPMPLMVEDDGDARVALPVAGLVHADRVQAVERRRHRRLQPFGDPMGDVSGGAPRDVRKTAHGPLVRDRHQPRALRLDS